MFCYVSSELGIFLEESSLVEIANSTVSLRALVSNIVKNLLTIYITRIDINNELTIRVNGFGVSSIQASIVINFSFLIN